MDDNEVVMYMLSNGCPPRRASTEINGYWHNLARAVSGLRKPTLRFTKAVARNWYCNRSGIQDAYRAALAAKEAKVSIGIGTIILLLSGYAVDIHNQCMTKLFAIKLSNGS